MDTGCSTRRSRLGDMVRIDDMLLMAYVDGEVDAATAREIETALAGDPSMASRLAAFRGSAAAEC